MPYIHINTNKTLNDTQKDDLKAMCGKIIENIPGKTENWLMVQINDQQDMYFKGQKVDCIKVDVQVYGSVSNEDQSAFVEALIDALNTQTNVDVNNIYVTLQEFPHWGLMGSYM